LPQQDILFQRIAPIVTVSQGDFVNTRFAALILLLVTLPAFADQVVLTNGDRLTGSIKKSDGKVVILKTDYAGEVTVKLENIQSVTSSTELSVTLGGKTVKGDRVTVADEKVVVATKSGDVEAPRSTLTMVRSADEQAAFEKSLHPGLLEGWNGGLNLGFALTRGNSETKNLNIAFNAVRTGFRDKLLLYETSIYAANDLPTATPHTTANAVGGGVRYDHDLTPRLFAFVNGDFYHDGLQFLDLRAIFGGGLGVHVIKSDATVLDLLAGANYTHESYSSFVLPTTPPTEVASVTRSLAGLTLGDSFVHKVGKGTVITQGLLFYPDLTHTGEYRGTFNLGTVTKLNKWFGWQNSFADIYVSDPPGGTKKNDLQLATGLNFTFTH
jgi:putative salt-induced outer membrane protein YdiY